MALLGDQLAPVPADGVERIVVHLAACDDRDLGVEQRDEGAQDARLRLAAGAEEDEVVLGKDGVDELGQHRLLVAEHAGKERRAALERGDEVVAQFLAHGTTAQRRLAPRALAEFPEGAWQCHVRCDSLVWRPSVCLGQRDVQSARPQGDLGVLPANLGNVRLGASEGRSGVCVH
jgi:hypothetical protein